MRKLSVAVLSCLVALVGFSGIASASATIDLLWGGVNTNTSPASSSSLITLDIVLTAGPQEVVQSGVSVDYSGTGLSVVSFLNAPNGFAPFTQSLGPNTDSGTQG